MARATINVQTRQDQEFIDITDRVEKAIRELGMSSGTCLIYVPHTTAGVTINETADPAVKDDILGVLQRLAPASLAYDHVEGNAHSHIQASLMGSSAMIAVEGGRLVKGTWQGVLFGEFDGPRDRSVWIQPLAAPASD
ncbi:MAG: secondary thiamine-phosphate synthase enzyme YjbQ [Candidatus Bipolaricaulia bacterium]